MVKVTPLIPSASFSEEVRQMMLAIICLAEKRVAAPEGYQDRLHAISMLAREAYDTLADTERISAEAQKEG